jgi:hypothetical protein
VPHPAGAGDAGPGRRGHLLPLRGAAPGHALAVVEQGHRAAAGRRPGGGAGRARHAPGPGRLAAGSGRAGRGGAPAARSDDPVAAGLAPGRAGALRRAAARAAGAHPAGVAGGGQPAPGPGPGRGRDRVPARALRRAGSPALGRGADDVRAGQLRALPAQDLQRQLDHRRQAAGALAVPDDPAHPPADPAAHPVGLQRQRRGDRGLPGRALPPGPRRRLPHRPGGTVGLLHQGGDPQPPDRDLAVPGRLHRRRRRDPRRGRHRPWRQAQGRPDRLHRLAPAHPHAAAAMGGRAPAQPAHGPGAGDHARRSAGWRGVQQRVRPAQPAGLLPQFRAAGGRGRRRQPPGARLRQADHAGRRPGRDRSHPGAEEEALPGRRGGGAWAVRPC